MLLIIDFGSQTTHLIGRRLRDLGAKVAIVPPEDAMEFINDQNPSTRSVRSGMNIIEGIVLAGGPMSVYEKNAPSIDKKIFSLGIPILGICYGFQLAAFLLGGKVIAGRKEYGPAKFGVLKNGTQLLKGVGKESTVWMNHGDEIVKLPKDFALIGQTKHVPFTCTVSKTRKIYGILFHPEVEHTEYGLQILQNFLDICKVKKEKHVLNPEKMVEKIKNTVRSAHVIGAVSGGVDSTVAAALVAKAIGKKFTPIFVNNGLMRDDAELSVRNLAKKFGLRPIIVECEKEMLKRLKGVTDSEEKRKVIGKFYIDVFEKEMAKLVKKDADVQFLMQGTIYSDVIESQGSKHASKIKSHHNVGGLPKEMKLQLLEPLREFYKDEVRALGKKIGLGNEFVLKQVFPGPGYAVRIRGEVTKERLQKIKIADKVVLDELNKANLLKDIYMSFPVMTGAYSTAVKGDGKFFGEVIALRVVQSKDVMSSVWMKLPYEVLQKISSRIVNEVPHISRVVYDISTKPPATMEWE